MNFDAIPWTTATVRVALEANGGNEVEAAWSVWRAMKITPSLHAAILGELASGDVVWGATASALEAEHRWLEGDLDTFHEKLTERMDPRENPVLAGRITDEAIDRVVAAFQRAVGAVAADWSERRKCKTPPACLNSARAVAHHPHPPVSRRRSNGTTRIVPLRPARKEAASPLPSECPMDK